MRLTDVSSNFVQTWNRTDGQRERMRIDWMISVCGASHVLHLCVSVTFSLTGSGQWHLWLLSVHPVVSPWKPLCAKVREPGSHHHRGQWPAHGHTGVTAPTWPWSHLLLYFTWTTDSLSALLLTSVSQFHGDGWYLLWSIPVSALTWYLSFFLLDSCLFVFCRLNCLWLDTLFTCLTWDSRKLGTCNRQQEVMSQVRRDFADRWDVDVTHSPQ